MLYCIYFHFWIKVNQIKGNFLEVKSIGLTLNSYRRSRICCKKGTAAQKDAASALEASGIQSNYQ